MWCPNCQADVAAEVSAENQRVRCATCSTEIQTGMPVRTGAKTEAARELLKKWANDDLVDPFGPLPGVAERPAVTTLDEAAAPEEQVSSTTVAKSIDTSAESAATSNTRYDSTSQDQHSQTATSRQQLRFDSAQTTHDESPVTRHSAAQQVAGESHQAVSSHTTTTRRVHSSHVTPIPGPPVSPVVSVKSTSGEDVRSALLESETRSGTWSSFWGQILAYLGVAGLTVGTSLVLWGYFGGPAEYTPTGWLIVTVGQMMLFLGVVTLVSGGMEQTTEEVARRVDQLGTRLIRIEHATRANSMNAPHTPVRQYGDQKSPTPAASQREQQRV